MKEIAFATAINQAMDEEMARDETVYLIGEDVSVGLFGVSGGLIQKYGKDRIIDTPISETAIAGSCLGAALAGYRPIADLMFADFIYVCMDEIKNAAIWQFSNGGGMKIPIVYRFPMGGYIHLGADHSRAAFSPVLHLPGMKVAVPTTPYDAKGLLKTAIRDNNPVCFFEHKLLYATTGQVPDEEYTIPFGVADVKKEGKDVTVVAIGLMVPWSLEVAKQFEAKGVSVEVIDPRTLEPLDIDTIVKSVRKTGRVVLVEEDMLRCGTTCEIAMQIMEQAFDALDAPIVRVGAKNYPIPGGVMETFVLPQLADIAAGIDKVLGR
jgi:acetoin:2,6-dichlorophenolindophenol oxidoreductase subunit beta